MTDYVGVAINGFCTGLGVILAQRFYRYWESRTNDAKEKFKSHPLFDFLFCERD